MSTLIKAYREIGGFYSPLFRGTALILDHVHEVVIKQVGWEPISTECGHLRRDLADIIVRDSNILRAKVSSSGVNVPRILLIKYVPDHITYEVALQIDLFSDQGTVIRDPLRILFIEEYVGPSIRELTRLGKLHNQIYEEVLRALKRLPLDEPIDCHPGNFTWFNGVVSYVDFIPPKIWEYRDIPGMLEALPTIGIKPDVTDKDRKFEHFTLEGRLSRFHRYLNQWNDRLL